jgi:ubiquinone/menaquinone biosynthesis C-methylase UbiE
MTKKLNNQSGVEQVEFDKHFQNIYSNEASHYDNRRFVSLGGSLSSQFECENVVDAVDSRVGMRILDIASGTGRAAIALAIRGAQVFSLDLTAAMLLEGRKKVQESEIDNVTFTVGNGRFLPFPDMSFDAITCTRFFHLLPVEEYPHFTREMERVLRPGGLVAVSIFNPLYGAGIGLIREAIRRLLQGRSPEHFLWPNQIKFAFDKLSVEKVVGFWLPGLLGWIGNPLVVIARK